MASLFSSKLKTGRFPEYAENSKTDLVKFQNNQGAIVLRGFIATNSWSAERMPYGCRLPSLTVSAETVAIKRTIPNSLVAEILGSVTPSV